MVDINIFLLCYNESALLPHTIKHYKKYLPSCKITIFDNESTDNSVEIAKSLGCNVIYFKSNNIQNEHIQNEYIQTYIKNNCWKEIANGWIIVADMDEYLCVTEEELKKEKELGTTVLTVHGYDMLGESNTLDLSDIDLQDIKKYRINIYENKRLCFLREHIKEMDYLGGAHALHHTPVGNIIYSAKTYINKHMSYLGLKFYKNKNLARYNITHEMRQRGMDLHYINNIEEIENNYNNFLNDHKLLP